MSDTQKSATKEASLARYRSKNGVLSHLYYEQSRRSKRMQWPPPNYNRHYILTRFLDDPLFDNLYASWVESGFQKMLRPSLDRIDASKPYMQTNIQMMTLGDNLRKAALYEHARTEVAMCELDGREIKRFNSMTEAAKAIGGQVSEISVCCRNQNRAHKGYRWQYCGRLRYINPDRHIVIPYNSDNPKKFHDEVVDYWHKNPTLNVNQVAEQLGVTRPELIYDWRYFRENRPGYNKTRNITQSASLEKEVA